MSAIELPDALLDEIARRAAGLVGQTPTPAEPWLNAEQAAEQLAISTSQLYTLCSQRPERGPGAEALLAQTRAANQPVALIQK